MEQLQFPFSRDEKFKLLRRVRETWQPAKPSSRPRKRSMRRIAALLEQIELSSGADGWSWANIQTLGERMGIAYSSARRLVDEAQSLRLVIVERQRTFHEGCPSRCRIEWWEVIRLVQASASQATCGSEGQTHSVTRLAVRESRSPTAQISSPTAHFERFPIAQFEHTTAQIERLTKERSTIDPMGKSHMVKNGDLKSGGWGFSIQVEQLNNLLGVQKLFERAVELGWVADCDMDRLRVFAAAKSVRRRPSVTNPPAAFTRIVRRRLWEQLADVDFETARNAVKELDRRLAGAYAGVTDWRQTVSMAKRQEA